MSIISVICDDLKNNLECPHGPTLKFVRLQNKKQHNFYACSTYRDRKDCGFYFLEGDKITEGKRLAWELEKKRVLPDINQQEYIGRLKKIESLSAKERGYCHTCNFLVFETDFACHKQHNLQVGISNHLLAYPSRLFKPKDNNKQEAQYFFSDKTTDLIVNNLKRLGVNKVVCMGTPRIHERVQELGGDMESMLLDLDHRYYNFFDEHKFAWFNMFNCHFLGNTSKSAVKVLQRFLCEGKIALVTDPPFGGRVEPLAYTVRELMKMSDNINSDSGVLVFWIFPYFMETQMLRELPELVMLDYRVAYDNHQQFQNGNKGRKHGSPVRIFSNVEPSKFPLPSDEGYILCEICMRWVSSENRHCKKCENCTSKDGQTYAHCDECGICVKPSWQHCKRCLRCALPDHNCLEKKEICEPSGFDEVVEMSEEVEEKSRKRPKLHHQKRQKQRFKKKNRSNKLK